MDFDLKFPKDIEGLELHAYQGESDLHKILQIFTVLRTNGYIDWNANFDDLKNEYEHVENCDLRRDFVMAEMNGMPIGYLRRWWEVVSEDDTRVHFQSFHLVPEWVNTEVGEWMMAWSEQRSKQVASGLPKCAGGDRLDTFTSESFTDKQTLLKRLGYLPLRYYFIMSRPLDGELPDQSLPEGIQVKPLYPSQLRQAWEASVEGFQDEWGAVKPTEEAYLRFKGEANNNPALYQVAWDGDEIIGMVMNFIDPLENEHFQRYRGYTEGISVKRPYRNKGLASALICRSMRMFKAMNMTEVALGVDAENPSGALGLYTRLGYKTYYKQIVYSKSLISPEQ